MTTSAHKVQMTLQEFEGHKYRYVTREGAPVIMAQNEQTGATELVSVEITTGGKA